MKCSEEGCEKKAVSRGMCSMHYQRWRRTDEATTGQVGRPRKYAKEIGEKHQGAPRITVRLEPHLLDWVKEQGGASFLRHVTGQLYELAGDENFREWWGRLQIPEDEDRNEN